MIDVCYNSYISNRLHPYDFEGAKVMVLIYNQRCRTLFL